MVKINIKLSNRWLYTILAIVIVVLAGVSVYAVAGVSHDASELTGVCKTDGTGCPADANTMCDTSGACTQVCIGTDCESSWPAGGGGSLWTDAGNDAIYYDVEGVGETPTVSIGTSTPSSHALHVVGTMDDAYALYVENDVGVSPAGAAYFDGDVKATGLDVAGDVKVSGNMNSRSGTFGNGLAYCSVGMTFDSTTFTCNTPFVKFYRNGAIRSMRALSTDANTLAIFCLALGGTYSSFNAIGTGSARVYWDTSIDEWNYVADGYGTATLTCNYL